MDKIKTSKTYISTVTSTKKSESERKDEDKPEIYIEAKDGLLQEINISDLTKANFSYSGGFIPIVEALNTLCTMNPKINGEYVIQRQDDERELYYKAFLKWDTFLDLAIEKSPLLKDTFRHQVMAIYHKAPNLYINLQNGYSMLTHPIIINSIIYEDDKKMTQKEAEVCSRIGITKKLAYLEIEFFKPLFQACLEKDEHKGFIWTDKAFYTKIIKTIDKIKNDKVLTFKFSKFYNPKTKIFVTKEPSIYYKFIMYFLTHLTSNEKADNTTFNAVEMLKHVDPGQLLKSKSAYTGEEKNYIKNKYDTKLFIDKACTLYNLMAQMGFCNSTKAVPKYCLYDETDYYQLIFMRETPRSKDNLEDFSSNFIEIEKNEPLKLEMNKNRKDFNI